MKKTFIFDFSRVILFPRDKLYEGKLNTLNRKLKEEEGERYRFFDHFELNSRLIDLVKQLKAKGYSLIVFTGGTIQNEKAVRGHTDVLFDAVVSSTRFNKEKNDSAVYDMLLGYLEKDASEVILIDDTLSNIKAAKEAGLRAIRYTTVGELEKELAPYFTAD